MYHIEWKPYTFSIELHLDHLIQLGYIYEEADEWKWSSVGWNDLLENHPLSSDRRVLQEWIEIEIGNRLAEER